MTIDTKRVEKTKNWKIADKFINDDFANFILNINDLDVYKRPINDAYGSIQEWADHFQLQEIHGIYLDDILKLFEDKGCVKIFKRDNYVNFHHQNMVYLETEIRARNKS